ncbi:MAG: CDGSH iron-sulfur domain-containing protein [Candidatus Peribacteria bacterium]|nr:CDGSH iron-sulfur domain-containing protein [Candidatus Peribacteria bacterium]
MIQDVKNNYKGPLFVQGGIEVESSDGESYPVRNRQTLCRCGTSNNMPFCDASHLTCEHMKTLDT